MYSEQSATPSAASQYFICLPHLHADHINSWCYPTALVMFLLHRMPGNRQLFYSVRYQYLPTALQVDIHNPSRAQKTHRPSCIADVIRIQAYVCPRRVSRLRPVAPQQRLRKQATMHRWSQSVTRDIRPERQRCQRHLAVQTPVLIKPPTIIEPPAAREDLRTPHEEVGSASGVYACTCGDGDARLFSCVRRRSSSCNALCFARRAAASNQYERCPLDGGTQGEHPPAFSSMRLASRT